MKWGLIPSWADDPKIGNPMINDRYLPDADTPRLKGPHASDSSDPNYRTVRNASLRLRVDRDEAFRFPSDVFTLRFSALKFQSHQKDRTKLQMFGKLNYFESAHRACAGGKLIRFDTHAL